MARLTGQSLPVSWSAARAVDQRRAGSFSTMVAGAARGFWRQLVSALPRPPLLGSEEGRSKEFSNEKKIERASTKGPANRTRITPNIGFGRYKSVIHSEFSGSRLGRRPNA